MQIDHSRAQSKAQEAIAKHASFAASLGLTGVSKQLEPLFKAQGALAVQNNVVKSLFEGIAKDITKNYVDTSAYAAWTKDITANLMPSLAISQAFSDATASALRGFQVDLPKGFLPSINLPVFPNDQLAEAIAGISGLIQSGEISEDIVEDAEEAVSDVQLFTVPQSRLVDMSVDMALHVSSAKVLYIAIIYIFVLSTFDKKIDFEAVVQVLMSYLAGKKIVEPAEAIIEQHRD